MESEEALGALCIIISLGVMLFWGHLFLAFCTVILFVVFFKVLGH